MTLYTSKVVAEWLGMTERHVRQLRDKGIIEEKRPGLYDLRVTVNRYISYIKKGSNDLNDERATLTRAKREAVEMENELRRKTLHRTEDIEKGLKKIVLNIRSRFLTLPAKLSEELVKMNGNQAEIFDTLKDGIEEVLEELSRFDITFIESGGEDGEDD